MRNYLCLGPLALKISNRGIANWGYERLKIGPLSVWSRSSSGERMIASYRRPNETWRWCVGIGKWPVGRAGIVSREQPQFRRGQWHDYYRLPFGRQLIVSRQDYHKAPRP